MQISASVPADKYLSAFTLNFNFIFLVGSGSRQMEYYYPTCIKPGSLAEILFRHPKMDKALIIKNLCELLLDDKKNDCIDFATTHYPFASAIASKRQYSKYQMCRVFLRDGFIDRYSSDKLLFPGLIKLLTIEFPEIFKYHKNWKMTETHLIYWELCPTIDHLVPVARGGQDNEDNWITTSMVHNSAKSNWTIEELNWTLHEKGKLENWDGLVNCFLDLTNKNAVYEKDNYIRDWKLALVKAKKEIKH